MATHIGDVSQEGENLEDANIPRQEGGEQTVKETKTGWLEMEDETQGSGAGGRGGAFLGRAPAPLPGHHRETRVVNIFVLIIFICSS